MRQQNDDAADMLPMRLIISLAIIAAIVVLLAGASETLRIYLAEQQVEQQCLFLRSGLSTMVVNGAFRDLNDPSAPDGAKRIHTFVLPDSLVYLAFGCDPEAVDAGEFASLLIQKEAVIIYKIDGGSKKVIWLPDEIFQFRGGILVHNRWVINEDSKQYVIRRGGITTLVFEYVQKNHNPYILIYYNR